MRYLVNFSTGLASFEAARRTIEQKGRENTTVIFCDSGGTVTPLPLDQFRREVESGTRKVSAFDWGGCGCFAPSLQMRFDELALEAATPRGAVKRPLVK